MRTNADSPARTEESRTTMTFFNGWLWLFAGAAYGVLMRVLFGLTSPSFGGAMSVGFLIGTPLAVGAISVYGSPAAGSSLLRALVVPFPPLTLMLVGCAIAMLEGSICIALMAPLFYALASLGGLCMALACGFSSRRNSTLCAFAVLPLLLLPFDRIGPEDTFHELHETVLIRAPVDRVWANILTAKDIRANELPLSLTHIIGVPRPVNAENRPTPSGEVRFSQWERGVRFSAHVTDRKELQSITWRYSFASDSFPAGTMDEHVVIGGKFLDLGDTTFSLKATQNGVTQLEVVGRYRLTTPINSYAVPVSKVLGGDFLRTLLAFYKGRSERAGA